MPWMTVENRCCARVAALWLAACLQAPAAETPHADAGVTPIAEAPGVVTRVHVTLDVTGELFMPVGGDAAPVREPVKMEATFDYEELPAAGQAGSMAEPAGAAGRPMRRVYREAAATMRMGTRNTKVMLPSDARDLLMARRGTTPLPYLPDGFLSGEEADLLDTPFDSLLIDEILPRQADATVAVGTAWPIPGDLAAGLLAIDTVESGELVARIERVNDGVAEASLSGIIDGAVDGVPTHVTVEGSFTLPAQPGSENAEPAIGQTAAFERRPPIGRLAVVILERREASHVAPGFEVEARVLIERTPAEGGLSADRRPAEAEQSPPGGRRRGAGGPGQVWYRDPQGGFDIVHDSRWRRVENGATGLVLRLVDRGALVGQCSITSLPRMPAAILPDSAGLKIDVERSLAGQIERIEAAEENDRADGLRVVRVTSSGTAGRLPFRWIHYVLAAQDGSRTSVTFVFEASMQERFADADRPLIEHLRLPAGRTAAAPGPVRQ